MTRIERAADFTGWNAWYGERHLGKFPSYYSAQTACVIEAAVQSAKAEG